MKSLTFSAAHRKFPSLNLRRTPAAVAVLALLMLPLVSGCSQESSSSAKSAAADPANPVVARVNGVEMRQSDLEMAKADLGDDLRSVAPEQQREHLITYVADIILVAKEAEQRKLDGTADFRQRQAFLRSKLLMAALLQSHAEAAVTDEALRKVYEEQVKPMAKTVEVRARHILFRADPKDAKALAEAEAKAKAALERIKKGEDFAKVATELTEDPTGKQSGGDLGYFTQNQMVPEFANVAFQMYPGQVSNPVKTAFGWHIIKLEDKRNQAVPEFDKIKDRIAAFVVRRAQSELVAELRKKAKIERLDKKDEPPAAAKKDSPPKK